MRIPPMHHAHAHAHVHAHVHAHASQSFIRLGCRFNPWRLAAQAEQNSLILLDKTLFDPASVVDLSAEALAKCAASGGATVAPGDLLCISVSGCTGPSTLGSDRIANIRLLTSDC